MSDLKELGVALKAYRIAAGESVDELANATELEETTIKKIEAGLTKPSSDAIGLIANHYLLREQEVKRLFKLAGHKTDDFSIKKVSDGVDIDISKLGKDIDVLMAPVLYTDMIKVTSDKFGLVISFLQKIEGYDNPVVVSRVGMSHKHANSVIAVLQESMKRANKKQDGESDSKTQ